MPILRKTDKINYKIKINIKIKIKKVMNLINMLYPQKLINLQHFKKMVNFTQLQR